MKTATRVIENATTVCHPCSGFPGAIIVIVIDSPETIYPPISPSSVAL